MEGLRGVEDGVGFVGEGGAGKANVGPCETGGGRGGGVVEGVQDRVELRGRGFLEEEEGGGG